MTPVISPPSRVFQCATLLFVLSGVRCSFSQSVHGPVASENQSLDLSLTLPDAPSYSSSQQSTPSQTTGQPGTAPASPTADQSQAGSQPPPNETPEQKKERERLEGEEQVRRQEHQRNLGVIPSFNTVIAGKVPPLTAGEKFDLVYHTLKDPYTFALAAIVSGFGELSPPGAGLRLGSWWLLLSLWHRLRRQRGRSDLGKCHSSSVAQTGSALLPQGRRLRKQPHHPCRALDRHLQRRQRKDAVQYLECRR